MSLAKAAEEFLATTRPRRCPLCTAAPPEVVEVAHRLRDAGRSCEQVARFLASTADEYGHGIRPTPQSLDNHFRRHRGSDHAEAQAKPRRRR